MVRAPRGRDHVPMNPTPSPTSPRLTRSTSDKRIAGVAGGLAAFLGVDPVVIRVSFAVATLLNGVGLLVYLLMMVLVPTDEHAVAGAQPTPA